MSLPRSFSPSPSTHPHTPIDCCSHGPPPIYSIVLCNVRRSPLLDVIILWTMVAELLRSASLFFVFGIRHVLHLHRNFFHSYSCSCTHFIHPLFFFLPIIYVDYHAEREHLNNIIYYYCIHIIIRPLVAAQFDYIIVLLLPAL